MKSQDLAVLATLPTEFEAQTKAEVLRSEGIEAAVTRNAPTWTGQLPISPTAVGSSVLVHRDDLDRARAILEKKIADSVDLDWDEIDVGQREDDLPLRPVNTTPPLARIALVVAWVLLVLSAPLLIWFVTTLL